jgi:hypothetical protein
MNDQFVKHKAFPATMSIQFAFYEPTLDTLTRPKHAPLMGYSLHFTQEATVHYHHQKYLSKRENKTSF